MRASSPMPRADLAITNEMIDWLRLFVRPLGAVFDGAFWARKAEQWHAWARRAEDVGFAFRLAAAADNDRERASASRVGRSA